MATDFTEFWLVTIPYRHKETMKERSERRNAARAQLKEAGFESEYKFHFKHSQAQKLGLAMKAKAEAKAKEIFDATGIEMEVTEGMYL